VAFVFRRYTPSMASLFKSPLTFVLVVLLALIQYPLWLGKGGWVRVWALDQDLSAQLGGNRKLVIRNAGLEGEVRDLKQGLLAVEEHARYKLGMVRPDEIFIQFNDAAATKEQSKTGAAVAQLNTRPASPILR
jgi:cell division protein FtsB